jgi:hypothetical protein
MVAAIFLWIIIILAVIVGLTSLFSGNLVSCVAAIIVLMICVNGLQRNDASETCDAINAVGGKATFLSGKCIILNSGGIPAEIGNDRLVYVNQQ